MLESLLFALPLFLVALLYASVGYGGASGYLVVMAIAPDPVEDVAGADSGMSMDELKQALSIHEPLSLVDIRSVADFEGGSLPAAVHCRAESILESGLPQELDCASKLVLLCAEGVISPLLADALRSVGVDNAFYLEGGLSALG